jgi:2-keto-4-pentenoate hydratase/2-oxohepta-3-ene-1,7-dioic acid hydratase in catechol pathway
MKLCRFNAGTLRAALGVVEHDVVYDISSAYGELRPQSYPLPQHDLFIAELPRLLGVDDSSPIRAALAKAKALSLGISLAQVTFLPPIANPSKIIGAPINYQAHIAESKADKGIEQGRNITTIGDWGMFLKANTSMIGVSDAIRLSFTDRRNDHEIELGVVIGKSGRNISRASAMDYVSGYMTCLDMTLRGTEFQCFRKSIDTYSVSGPYFVTKDEIADPNNLDLWLTVNGQPRQRSNTQRMVFDVQRLIEFASSFYTLHPGDIIMTGTPEGVGPVVAGDEIHCGVQDVGEFKINVVA